MNKNIIQSRKSARRNIRKDIKAASHFLPILKDTVSVSLYNESEDRGLSNPSTE